MVATLWNLSKHWFLDSNAPLCSLTQVSGSAAPAQAVDCGCPRLLLRHDCESATTFYDQQCFLICLVPSTLLGAFCFHKLDSGMCSAKCETHPEDGCWALSAACWLHSLNNQIGQYPPFNLQGFQRQLNILSIVGLYHWYQLDIVAHRAEQHAPIVRKRRYSMIAVLTLDEGIYATRVREPMTHFLSTYVMILCVWLFILLWLTLFPF